MNVLRFPLLLFAAILISPCILQAQDGTFTQFTTDRPLLNPALTGLDEGLSASMHYRNQWFLADRGFKTYSVCVECREEDLRSGYGFYALRDVEGAGNLAFLTAGGAYSFAQSLGSNQALHIGANVAYVERSIDFSRLIFSDQIAPYDGILSSPTAAPVPLERRAFADLGVGLAYRGAIIVRQRVNGSTEHYQIGFVSGGWSWQHGHEPPESLRGVDFSLPSRQTIHFGLSLPFLTNWLHSEKYYCTVSLLARYQRQGNLRSTLWGVAWLYRGWEPGLFVLHRALPFIGKHSDNLVASLGWESVERQKRFYRVQLSYDIGIGGIRTAAGGAFELSLRLRASDLCKFKGRNKFKQYRHKPVNPYKCPTFDKWSDSRQH